MLLGWHEIGLPNGTEEPQRVSKHKHIGYVRSTTPLESQVTCAYDQTAQPTAVGIPTLYSRCVYLGQDDILVDKSLLEFRSLLEKYEKAFPPI